MKEFLTNYIAARSAYEEARDNAKAKMEDFKLAIRELAEHLMDEGLQNTQDEHGRMFSLRPSFWYRTSDQVFEKTLSWLEQRGENPEQYWKKRVNKRRLTELLKKIYKDEGKQVEEGANEHGVPDFLGLDTQPTISVRGWKGQDDEQRGDDTDD